MNFKKRLFIFGFIAVILFAIAASNSAIIHSIDNAYTQIITSDISDRKAISYFERGCNSIQSKLVNMLLTEDTLVDSSLQEQIYETFNQCDKYLLTLEKSNFPTEHRELMVSLRASYLTYREATANYLISFNNTDCKANSTLVTSKLQKKFTHLLGIIDNVTAELDHTVQDNSKSITKQNDMALRMITGAGVIPFLFWTLLLITTLFGTSVAIGKYKTR